MLSITSCLRFYSAAAFTTERSNTWLTLEQSKLFIKALIAAMLSTGQSNNCTNSFMSIMEAVCVAHG